MRRVVVFSAGIVVVGLMSGVALAADYPAEPGPLTAVPVVTPVVAPPVVAPPPPYNWNGLYLGVNGGYGFGQSSPMSLFSDSFSAFNYNANGWLAGVTVGAQLQNGHTLLGLEADIDFASMSGSSRGSIFSNGDFIGTATLSSTLSSVSTLRSRVGYAYDNWLFYGTGGLAFTNQTSTLTRSVGFVCGSGVNGAGVAVPGCSSPTNFHIGLTAGLGVEYGITPNLSAKGEWLWLVAGVGNTLTLNMLRAGVNWRFGM
jgi:outer membrane immunogenic protein